MIVCILVLAFDPSSWLGFSRKKRVQTHPGSRACRAEPSQPSSKPSLQYFCKCKDNINFVGSTGNSKYFDMVLPGGMYKHAGYSVELTSECLSIKSESNGFKCSLSSDPAIVHPVEIPRVKQ